jgi:hypothetical protein
MHPVRTLCEKAFFLSAPSLLGWAALIARGELPEGSSSFVGGCGWKHLSESFGEVTVPWSVYNISCHSVSASTRSACGAEGIGNVLKIKSRRSNPLVVGRNSGTSEYVFRPPIPHTVHSKHRTTGQWSGQSARRFCLDVELWSCWQEWKVERRCVTCGTHKRLRTWIYGITNQ